MSSLITRCGRKIKKLTSHSRYIKLLPSLEIIFKHLFKLPLNRLIHLNIILIKFLFYNPKRKEPQR